MHPGDGAVGAPIALQHQPPALIVWIGADDFRLGRGAFLGEHLILEELFQVLCQSVEKRIGILADLIHGSREFEASGRILMQFPLEVFPLSQRALGFGGRQLAGNLGDGSDEV